MDSTQIDATLTAFQLRFDALQEHRRSLSFECDAEGAVDIDALDQMTRYDYFRARTLIGREFAPPVVDVCFSG